MNTRILAALLSIAMLSGCGAMQNYNQGLENNHNNFTRSQRLLDEQNTIEVNKLQAIQREQDIQKARAEGAMAQAKAAGDAQAAIETARGEATANKLVSQSLTPQLIQYDLVQSLSDKNVIYLPSGMLPLLSVGK